MKGEEKMQDVKEQFVNNIVTKLNPDDETARRLKNLLYMELYDYSLTRIGNTDVAVYEEGANEEAVRMFFIAKNIQGCTPRTIEYYKQTIRAFVEFVQNKPFKLITTNDIRYYLAVKKERDKNSDRSIDNIRRVLSSFFSWLQEEEYIEKNPMLRVKKVRTERYVKKAFKDMEVEKLRQAAKENVRLTALIEVLLSTGCRISELRGMDVNDIDGDEIVVKGKGKKERIVYLNARARIALEAYIKSRDDDSPALFVTMDKPHSRLEIASMGKDIRDLGAAAGVTDAHPHRFRRTAATMALNRGMPIDQVQIMLGHSSIETTTIYAVSAQETVKSSHKKYLA